MSNRGAVLPNVGIGQPIDFDQFQRGQQIQLQRESLQIEKERNALLDADRKAREDEMRSYKNQQFLKDATDTGGVKTGPERIQNFTIAKLNEIKNEYAGKAGTMDINTLASELYGKITPIISGYSAAKQKTIEEQAKVSAAVAGNKNLNKEKLLEDVYKSIGDHYLVEDKDGKLTFKAIDKTDQTLDYTGNLLSAPDYHKYAMGTDPLTKSLETIKTVPVTAFVAKGPYARTKWTGTMTDFQKLNVDPDEHGFVKKEPALEFVKETHNGVDMLPDNLFKAQIYDSLEKQIAFDNAFDSFAKAHRLTFTDPDALDKARRAFALNEIVKPHIKNQMNPEVYNEPRQPYISVGGGNSSNNGRIDLRDPIYKDVDGGKDITVLMQGVKVTGLPSGKSLLANSVVFDPATKKVTYQEYIDEKDDRGNYPKKTVSLTTFLQNIKTNNPGIDMKFLEGLWNPIVDNNKQTTQYVDIKVVNGVKWGKKKDGTIEKVKE